MEIDASGPELVVSFVRNGEVLNEFYCTDGTAVTALARGLLAPRTVLRYRTDFINRIAIGRFAITELAEGPNLAFVTVHDTEYPCLIGARRDAFLRSILHALGQQSRIRRHGRHAKYGKRPRGDAAIKQCKQGYLPLTSACPTR
jgi:hypothetical protein